MPISLILTPFDYFQICPSFAVTSIRLNLILEPCLTHFLPLVKFVALLGGANCPLICCWRTNNHFKQLRMCGSHGLCAKPLDFKWVDNLNWNEYFEFYPKVIYWANGFYSPLKALQISYRTTLCYLLPSWWFGRSTRSPTVFSSEFPCILEVACTRGRRWIGQSSVFLLSV